MHPLALSSPSIGVAVITHCAKHHLRHCLPPYLECSLKPRVLVVNSSSNDGTVELAEELGAETLVIPRDEFNHGSTRERARRALGTDIVVMVTPDAYPTDPEMLTRLVAPIREGKAAIAYARQIPHDGSGIFEAFPRTFNYPEESQLRSIEDSKHYGVYTFFCSNSCAAYSSAALESVGGFHSVLLGEDTVATASLLRKGHKIAYVAEAVVKHSHRYSIQQEFRRYFDTGLMRSAYTQLLDTGRSDESRGQQFLIAFCKELAQKQPLAFPYALLHTAAKWIGYRLGRLCKHAPVWIKRSLSSQDFYWNSRDFLDQTIY
ncbi:MAG: glycosyltransferase family 2 protein [Chlamydiia bacterium]|nr:glycosyltransferase family 2 protein [Chlamydiia bacterium]